VSKWIKSEQLGTRLIMQVHDELVLEVPDDEVERVRVRVPELMSSVAQLKVPLLAEVGVGANWDEAH
jgi:DNA polymerase I